MFRANPQRTGFYNTDGVHQGGKLKWKLQLTIPYLAPDACPVIADGLICIGSSQGPLYSVDAQTGQQKWTFNAGCRAIGSPSIADGVVYVGTSDGTFYAIVLLTGQQKWKFKMAEKLAGGEYYSPIVANGVIYVSSPDGRLYALATQTGQQIWSFSNKGNQLTSPPTIADGILYFGSHDGCLV